jgi:hypothetical protein
MDDAAKLDVNVEEEIEENEVGVEVFIMAEIR